MMWWLKLEKSCFDHKFNQPEQERVQVVMKISVSLRYRDP